VSCHAVNVGVPNQKSPVAVVIVHLASLGPVVRMGGRSF